MTTQYISGQEEKEQYKTSYPLVQNTRLRRFNVARIKARATRYGQSVDDILTEILDGVERREKAGLE